jgi:hypothetical protein
MRSLHSNSFPALLAAAIVVAPFSANAQAKHATVELHGADGQILVVSDSDFAKLGRQDVQADAHHVKGTFNGVCVYDLLRLVGAPPSDSLRGAALAAYVLIEAADGYRVVYSIAELSPGFAQHEVMIVDRMNGAPLPAKDGPFRLIAPDDKAPSRWVRQVTKITIVMLPREATPPTR